ncbi:MAG TPA: hypothetical protein VGK79_16460 [Gaiellaceae bacterium]|jgi:hypothetical protein
MATETALSLLRAADPAANLEPLRAEHRMTLRDGAMAVGQRRAGAYPTTRKRAVARIAIAVVAFALLSTGIAWAAGALSPLALFEANPQSDGSAPGSLWDQKVIGRSVEQVGSVKIPRVGDVALWYGRTRKADGAPGFGFPAVSGSALARTHSTAEAPCLAASRPAKWSMAPPRNRCT